MSWTAFLSLGFLAATPQLDLEDILRKVAVRLEEQKEELPDFVCQEQVLIRTWYAGGGDRTQARGTYDFRVSQRFGEERLPVQERDHRIQRKIVTLGGVFPALYALLGKRNWPRLDIEGRLEGRSLLLSASVPADESQTTIRLDQGELPLGYKADVEVDARSHQPIRLERVVTSDVGSLEYLKHVLIYHRVRFGRQSFYLPEKQTTLLRFGATWYQAQHDYKECRRFVVEIK